MERLGEADAAPQSSALPTRLFDYFALVGPLDPHAHWHDYVPDAKHSVRCQPGARAATLLSRYPLADRPDRPFNDMLPSWCLPDGYRIEEAPPPPPRFHAFVFTDESSVRSYGGALVVWEPVPYDRAVRYLYRTPTTRSTSSLELRTRQFFLPKALCLTSAVPGFSLFRHTLQALYECTMRPCSLPIERIIVNVVDEVPCPPRGKTAVQMQIGPRLITTFLPPVNALDLADVPFHYLFHVFQLWQVLELIECVLLEQRVLLHSARYPLLTVIAEAVLALILPFRWPHTYIPLLPPQLVDAVHLPTPFLLGMHTQYLGEADVPPGVIIVDIDQGRVDVPGRLPALPPHERKKLDAAMRPLVASLRRHTVDLDAFMLVDLQAEPALPTGAVVSAAAGLASPLPPSPATSHVTAADLPGQVMGPSLIVAPPSPVPSSLPRLVERLRMPERAASAAAGNPSTPSPPLSRRSSESEAAPPRLVNGGRRRLSGWAKQHMTRSPSTSTTDSASASASPSPSSSRMLATSSASHLGASGSSSAAEDRSPTASPAASAVDVVSSSGSGSGMSMTAQRTRAAAWSSAATSLAAAPSVPLIAPYDRPMDPAFAADVVRAHFLRFFVSVFIKYHEYLTFPARDAPPDDATGLVSYFDADAFVDDAPEAARDFLHAFCATSVLRMYMRSRTYPQPHDWMLLLFDESICAKLNRSRMVINKFGTPFLEDPSTAVTGCVAALPPNPADLPPPSQGDGYCYPDGFPPLQHELTSVPRCVRSLAPQYASSWLVSLARLSNRMHARKHESALKAMQARAFGTRARKDERSHVATAVLLLQRWWRYQVPLRRLRRRHAAAARIQAVWRARGLRTQFLRQRRAAVVLQRIWRGYAARTRYRRVLLATALVQRCVRARRQRQRFLAMRAAATAIAAAWRGFAAWRRYQRLRRAVCQLQRLLRSWRWRVAQARRVHAATLVQRMYRGARARAVVRAMLQDRLQILRTHLLAFWDLYHTSWLHRAAIWSLPGSPKALARMLDDLDTHVRLAGLSVKQAKARRKALLKEQRRVARGIRRLRPASEQDALFRAWGVDPSTKKRKAQLLAKVWPVVPVLTKDWAPLFAAADDSTELVQRFLSP